MAREQFEVVSKDYYSNCLIEAIKAKLKNHRLKIIFFVPWRNEIFCPHFMWSDGKYDYDFGCEYNLSLPFAWTIHKGHIRRRSAGFARRYKEAVDEWREKHKSKPKNGRECG